MMINNLLLESDSSLKEANEVKSGVRRGRGQREERDGGAEKMAKRSEATHHTEW